MLRTHLITCLAAAAAITGGTLIARAQTGTTPPAQPGTQAGQGQVNGAVGKAVVRNQAKQAAANKPVGSTSVSFEQPISFPDDI